MKPLKCNGCTLCCQGDAIRKLPGDDENLKWVHHQNGGGMMMLDHKPNGDCYYLVPEGCGLHHTGNKPQQCIGMDCRNITKLITRKNAKKNGIIKVWKRGKELLSRSRF